MNLLKKRLVELVENYRSSREYAQDLLSDVFPMFQDSPWSIQQIESACWKALNYLKGLVWNTNPEQTGMFLEELVEETYPLTYAVRIFILASRYLEGKDDLEWRRLQVNISTVNEVSKAWTSRYSEDGYIGLLEDTTYADGTSSYTDWGVFVGLPNIAELWADKFNTAQ